MSGSYCEIFLLKRVPSRSQCGVWPIQTAYNQEHWKLKGHSDLLAVFKTAASPVVTDGLQFSLPLFISLPPSCSVNIRLCTARGEKRYGRVSWGRERRMEPNENRGRKKRWKAMNISPSEILKIKNHSCESQTLY
ncbi:hypothetical protein ILYODFUR_032816 [Ilyodon furcidens]|uniref:Uncharacterized protein n=1 Tax=Ilyodon furcidens TaxID=33524 RepID=A0ABV0UBN0_9TELE